MIFLNDKPSDIKEDDSKELMLWKISKALNTIPENIIIKDKTAGNITAVSISEEIAKLGKKRGTTYESMKKIILEQNDEIPEANIKYEYVIYNQERFSKMPGGEQFFNLLLSEQDGIDFQTISRDIDSYKRNKEVSIDNIEASIAAHQAKIKEVESIKGVAHTPFEVDLVTYYIDAILLEYEYAPSSVYALDLFAASKTNENVPYMQLKYNGKNYYKIQEQLPDIKIKDDTEEYSMFWIVNDGTNSYTTVFFEFDPVINVFKIIFNAIQQRRHEAVIKNVIESLPPISQSPQKELSVRGTVIFENINVNYLALADMILNDPLFSKRLYIDESSAVVSQKSRLNIHYKLPDDNKILFMVTNEEMPRQYLHVRISKAPNRETVEEFSDMLGKLLTQYTDSEKDVIEFYESFGIDLTEKEKRIMKKKKEPIKKSVSKVKTLASNVPDLFVKDYARRCLKKQQPVIIDPSEIEQYEEDNYQVMEFPKGDDPNKRYYICDNDPYLYPGLQKNTLPNKEQYPYIPCCFSDPQIGSHRSKYTEYMSGIDPEKREKKDISHMITILKVIDTPYRLANLPKDVSTWLSALLEDEEDKYFRMGVVTGPLNFIHAVLSAVDDEYNALPLDGKVEFVNNFLKTVNESLKLEACKQSNYELTMSELTELWLDPAKYHDALRFVRLMEIALKIKIIIISPDQILVPRYIKFYARTPLNRVNENVVLLFNHYGSAGVDALKDAHNEVIVNKSGTSIFKGANAQKLYDAYEKAVTFRQVIDSGIADPNSYTLESVEINHALIFSRPDILTPKFQYIDGYGKTRLIAFEFNRKITVLQITPSMPYNLESIELEHITDFEYLHEEEALELISKLNGVIIGSKYAETDEVNGFWFYVGIRSALYFLPTSSPPQQFYPALLYETLWDGLLRVNKMKQLRKSRKQANILLSFFYYLLKLYKISLPMTVDNAAKFLDTRTVLMEGHEYEIPEKRILPPITSNRDNVLAALDTSYPSHIRGGKLIISSNEMKDRLAKILKSDVHISHGDKIFKTILKYLEFLIKLYKKVRPLTTEDIESFMNRNITIITDHRYYEITPNLPDISSGDVDVANVKASLNRNYFDDGKLIVSSNDMRKTVRKILSTNLEIGEIETLNGLLDYNYDFIVKPHEQVFVGDEQFNNYMKFSGRYKDYLNLYSQVQTNPTTEFPYVMEFPEFYGLVQNTFLSTFKAALSVGVNWHALNYNTGFDTSELDIDFDRYEGDIVEFQIVDGEWKEDLIHTTRGDIINQQPTLYILTSGEFYSAVIKV